MVLAVDQQIWFYRSHDLKAWTKTSEFGSGWGAHGGSWEVPDLFELPLGKGPETRWVLIVSVGADAPAGGSGMQYFVGDFDGQTFTSQDTPSRIRWVDFGPDFYAAISWSNIPDGRRLWLGWMSNWLYARETPTATWRGSMSVPRELSLSRNHIIYLDRARSRQIDFLPAGEEPHTVKLSPLNGLVTLHLFIDRSSVELFANGGWAVLTEQIFSRCRQRRA